MPARTIAIGDIHGCSLALAALVKAIAPTAQDTLVVLGDGIDRGIDSKGVIDQLLTLKNRCRLVCLVGNHEEMMLEARADRRKLTAWLTFGGDTTLDSYGDRRVIPLSHWTFMRSWLTFYENETHLFAHANYNPNLPLAQQDRQTLLWLSLQDKIPEPHVSGKIAIVGHTDQDSGEILDLGHLKCIDTGCCFGGWLTALDLTTGQLWQANERGELRHR